MSLLLTLFTHSSSVSNVEFKNASVCWFSNIDKNDLENTRSLKDHLNSILPWVGVAGNFVIYSWKRPPCKFYQLKKKSSAFKKRTFVEIYHNDKALTWNSKNTVYFPECNESVANSLLEAPRPNVVTELTAIKVLTK